MCGIVGLSLRDNHPNAESVVGEMANRIVHRGPDSGGYRASTNGLAHVGFRRLAIRDLNPRANQPMLSASGRTAIVFNGEVYNSQELAARYLPDFPLQTSGDTEVVLEAIERHGLDVLPELNGMFAMAIVDMQSGETTLVRDRMGKKPLYMLQRDDVIAFGSELRCLKPFGLQVSPETAGLFFHFGYYPAPHTHFADTTQVCPGEVVTLRGGEVVSRNHYHRFTDQPWSDSEVEIDQLDALFADSVRLRKLSDVPLGAFLSGGVDSALVAAQLGQHSQHSEDPTPTFTVAFRDNAHDESKQAAETAAELGLPHQVIAIEEQNLSELATEFQDCYEQPYADTSGLVTMLLCRAVKQRVTVALSGDGGDEFFGGYARYSWFRKGLSAQRVPAPLRRLASLGIAIADRKRGRRLARWLNARDPASLYAEILRNWNVATTSSVIDRQATAVYDPVDVVRDVFDKTDGDGMSKAACFDATYYIPDDLQVKLDRASMQVALEVRCPLLDYRIAAAGASLRTESKYRDGSKTMLKQLLRRHVSPQVLNRPKHGFNVPLARWLRGPMRSLVDDTLRQRSIVESGWLNASVVNHVWDEFLGGKQHYAHSVWMLFGTAHHLRPPAANPLFTSLFESPRERKAA